MGRTFLTLGACNSHGTKTSCSSSSNCGGGCPSNDSSPNMVARETFSAPFLTLRADPTPDNAGSCSRAQTTMRMVAFLEYVPCDPVFSLRGMTDVMSC